MADSRFVYVAYIRAPAARVWDALIKPEFTRQYWSGTHQESSWQKGGTWKIVTPDGRAADTGEVVEFDPPRRLAVTWQNHLFAEMEAEGHSKVAFDLEEAKPGETKLTVTHEMARDASKLIEAVSTGWPGVISNLKSFLETGAALQDADKWPAGV